MITITVLFIVTIAAGVLAVVDGIARVRGRGGSLVVGIAELVFAILMLLALFVAFPAPLTLLTWAVLLEAALVVGLFVGRVKRGRVAITIAALVLNTIVVLVNLGWLTVPGLF